MAQDSDSEIDLSLSCGSSLFDEGEEAIISDTQESDEDAGASCGIHPYQFEPYAPGADSANSDMTEENSEVENLGRLQNMEWCDFFFCKQVRRNSWGARTILF